LKPRETGAFLLAVSGQSDKTAAAILGHSGQSKQECSLYVAFISFAAGHYLCSKMVEIDLFREKIRLFGSAN
jgi:hypothetical protein